MGYGDIIDEGRERVRRAREQREPAYTTNKALQSAGRLLRPDARRTIVHVDIAAMEPRSVQLEQREMAKVAPRVLSEADKGVHSAIAALQRAELK